MGTQESDSATSVYGTCDVCGKEADAAAEECVNIVCSAACNRPEGDIYHTQCIKKYVGAGAKGTQGKCPKIPYGNFSCPKGKSSKSLSGESCKGIVLHCKRIIPKSEAKAPPPALPKVSSSAGSSKRQCKAAAKAAAETAAAPAKKRQQAAAGSNAAFRPPRPSLPQLPVTKLPPTPAQPKPDPLGRNLSKDRAQQELPPGMAVEETGATSGPGPGKATKKNQKRAAKRRGAEADGTSSADWEQASSGAASESGHADSASGFCTAGFGLGAAAGSIGSGSVDHASLMGTGRFITDIARFNALLARQLGSDSSEEEDQSHASDDEEVADKQAQCDYEQAARAAGWQPPPDAAENDAWQGLTATGGWAAQQPGTRPVGVCTAAAEDGGASTAVGRWAGQHAEEEDAQLRAVLAESVAAAASNAGAGDAEFERQLAIALAESKRAEEEKQRQEREAQAALLAAFNAHLLQQHKVLQEPWQAAAAPAAAATTSVPIVSYYQAPQQPASVAGALSWQSGSAAVSLLPATSLQQVQLYQQQQGADAHHPAFHYAPAAAPSAAATAAPGAAAAPPPYLQQQVQPQHQPAPARAAAPLPWLQPHPALGAAAAAAVPCHGFTGVAAMPAPPPPAAAADEDDDLGELLALLTTS